MKTTKVPTEDIVASISAEAVREILELQKFLKGISCEELEFATTNARTNQGLLSLIIRRKGPPPTKENREAEKMKAALTSLKNCLYWYDKDKEQAEEKEKKEQESPRGAEIRKRILHLRNTRNKSFTTSRHWLLLCLFATTVLKGREMERLRMYDYDPKFVGSHPVILFEGRTLFLEPVTNSALADHITRIEKVFFIPNKNYSRLLLSTTSTGIRPKVSWAATSDCIFRGITPRVKREEAESSLDDIVRSKKE